MCDVRLTNCISFFVVVHVAIFAFTPLDARCDAHSSDSVVAIIAMWQLKCKRAYGALACDKRPRTYFHVDIPVALVCAACSERTQTRACVLRAWPEKKKWNEVGDPYSKRASRVGGRGALVSLNFILNGYCCDVLTSTQYKTQSIICNMSENVMVTFSWSASEGEWIIVVNSRTCAATAYLCHVGDTQNDRRHHLPHCVLQCGRNRHIETTCHWRDTRQRANDGVHRK